MWKSRVLSDKEQAVESSRRTRALSRCVEADLTGDERKCPLSLPNLPRHSNPAAAAEDRKGYSTEKAQQERLHPSEGVETGTNAIDLEQLLAAFILKRMSFAVETGGLLPTHHFGAWIRRSAEQALLLLGEHIYTV